MSAPDDALTRLGLRQGGIPDGHPDRDLLLTIQHAVKLDVDRDDAFANWNARPGRRRGTKREAEDVFRRIADQHDALERKVVRTRATTVDGARAKLNMVLRHSNFDADDGEIRGGTMMCLPLSAIRDALAVLG